LSSVCSDDEAWLHTSKGTMSVAAAVRQGLKVNHRGQAVEARSEDVVCHVLIHYCDVVAMAIVLGMLAPAGYETEPRVVNSADKTSAMRFVMDKVREGTRVRLIPKQRDSRSIAAFYLHNKCARRGRQLKARFIPDAIMLTRNVGMSPGNDWTASVFKKRGIPIHAAFPIALVGSRGWQTPRKGRPWPRVMADAFCGHTGMGQVARMGVVFEVV